MKTNAWFQTAAPLVIAVLCSTSASALTPTPTRFPCPTATPQPLWVDPVTSPTDALSQVVVVHIGYGSRVEITTESGTFVATGSFQPYSNPAEVTVQLLPNTVHHLTVRGTVAPSVDGAGCMFGGYTLRTSNDRLGAPLVIVQGLGDGPTPTATQSPTPTQTGSSSCRCLQNGGQPGPGECPCNVEQCFHRCVDERCPDTENCMVDCSFRCSCAIAPSGCITHVDPGPTPTRPTTPCLGDGDGDRRVTIDELVGAVANALSGCPQ
jgi:hypothetical protein